MPKNVNLNRLSKVIAVVLLITTAIVVLLNSSHYVSADNTYRKIGIVDAVEGQYSSRRLIVWGTHQEPSIKISAYDDVKRDVKIDVYNFSKDEFLNFLTYKVDNSEKYIANVPDVSKLKKIVTIDTKGIGEKTLLPIEGVGFWLLRAYSSDGEQTFSAVVRTSIGTMAREGNKEIILWTQNIVTGKKVNSGSIEIFSLKDKPTYLSSSPIDSDGIAKTLQSVNADVGFVNSSEGQTLIILNLPSDYYNYQNFSTSKVNTKYLLFTDRPLYTPGDKVYFKAIIRNDDNAEYSIPTGLVTVKVYKDYNSTNLLFEKKYPISANGTISGEYSLENTARPGTYQISVNIGETSDREWYLRTVTDFNVEYYRKPEYNLDINVEKDEFLQGENVSLHFSGKYFSGQAISGGKVKYSVKYSANQYYTEENLEYYKKYGYSGYYYGKNEIKNEEIELNDKGEAEIVFGTYMLPRDAFSIISVEASYQDQSGNPVRASKNILLRGNEYSIRAGNYEYYAKAEQSISIPLTLLSHSDAPVSNVNISVFPIRGEWLRDDKNLLNSQGYYNYHFVEENLPNFSVTTNDKGEAVVVYVPQKTGSHSLYLKVSDRQGNIYEKKLSLWITKENVPYYTENSSGVVTLKAQDREFSPGENVPVNISLGDPNKDVLITIERDRVRRYFVTSVPGYTSTIYVPTFNTDLPNVFVSASTFTTKGNHLFNSSSKAVTLSKSSKEINVSIIPGAKKYAPGETVELRIKTTDSSGLPISSEVAVWAVDKSLYELISEQRAKIIDVFWGKRYNSTSYKNSFEGITSSGGAEKGCFVGETLILTPNGLKQIKDIKVGDQVLTRRSEIDPTLVKATVKKVHSIITDGYLILNGNIKVTPEHRVWVNNSWKDVGNIQIGDLLIDKNNKEVKVNSIEWQAGKTAVYNLTVENKATYFAGNIYVHNQKGDGGSVRDSFADVAYWNPQIQTDANGNAVVRFVLPDNLTTWLVQGLAVTYDTKVGENATDLLVTKSVIVRPILPNILRIGDDVTISTLSHNFTGSSKQFENALSFMGGSVIGNKTVSLIIDNNSFVETLWKLNVLKPGIAEVKTSLQSNNNPEEKDIVSVKIPVQEFGFNERTSFVGEGNVIYDTIRFPDTNASSSKANLYLSASLFGTLPPAIDYLLQYPYGCVEQTTSRFVPAVIIKENESIFRKIIGDKDLQGFMKTGIDRLSILKDGRGGWGWWYGEVNPFITGYVIEYLKRAEKIGAVVPRDLYESTKTRFENELPKISDPITRIGYIYTLSLLDSPLGKEEIKNFGTSTPDIIALGLLSNIRNGFTDRSTNGYDLLQETAYEENGKKYWNAGTWKFFGSREASTALALRALLEAGASEEMTIGAARYLVSERKSDYWHNTFATSQTIDALLEFTKKYSKGSSTSYKVLIGEKMIDSGTLQGVFDTKTISIDPNLLTHGARLRIEPLNDNQIYSTFVFDQFRTGKDSASKNNGLDITRTYSSSFGIGDVVDINIRVLNIPPESRYLVIEDELPAGLVPINKSFENERSSSAYNPSSYYYWGGDREYTKNGIIASFSYVHNSTMDLTYQARVVSRGTFNVPPARASLMYEPEINGRTGTDVVTITGQKSKSVFNQGDQTGVSDMQTKYRVMGYIILLMLIIAGITHGYDKYKKISSRV
ncbi:MAG: alpha-2-macroglobulin family protein [Candidatus Paceibacterota bacterium]|jgi:hypothetical protein